MLPSTCGNSSTWTQVTASLTAQAGHRVTLTLASNDNSTDGHPNFTLYDDIRLQ